jgi:hypothetical protein
VKRAFAFEKPRSCAQRSRSTSSSPGAAAVRLGVREKDGDILRGPGDPGAKRTLNARDSIAGAEYGVTSVRPGRGERGLGSERARPWAWVLCFGSSEVAVERQRRAPYPTSIVSVQAL